MNNMTNILTSEDLGFLKQLAYELKTQDNAATAKPLIFKIRETVKQKGVSEEYADGSYLVDEETGREFYSVDELIEFLEEQDWMLNPAEEIENYAQRHGISFDEREIGCYGKALQKMGYDFFVGYYKEEIKLTGEFLTANSAEDYLKQNRHAHNETAHVYITHGRRNPVLERLLEIVEKFDM